jgi:hypothetical protein
MNENIICEAAKSPSRTVEKLGILCATKARWLKFSKSETGIEVSKSRSAQCSRG